MPPLTYLSNSAILRYLPIDIRQELAKKVPILRVANRNIPYRLEDVAICTNPEVIALYLDNRYMEYFFVNGKIILSTPENRYETEYSDDDILPGDIEMRNKYLRNILKFFFNRPGTSVEYMSFDNSNDIVWCEQNDFNDIQLKIGTLDVSNQKMNKQCTMELFKNSQFSKIDLIIYDLEDIDWMKNFKHSPNAHYNVHVDDDTVINLQSLVNKLNESGLKCTLELGYNNFKTLLETLKTSRNYPLFTVKSTQYKKEPLKSQLKNMGGVKSFATKDCKIQCYTFPTSDPEKEFSVTWEDKDSDIRCFEANFQKSGSN